jgi:diguanylate cyclase (GGDEF)-like protein
MELVLAVRQRTEELERGQAADGARNRILEMLVSNEPLDSVLDAIARLAQDQAPGAGCLILLKQGTPNQTGCGDAPNNSVRIVAAPGTRQAWRDALGYPHAIPFEIWRQPGEYNTPIQDPAWRGFAARLRNEKDVPEVIRSVPIGDTAASFGAILLAHGQPDENPGWSQRLRGAARLAQIALEHRQFCDDLNFQAHHDSLTKLPNRVALNQRLEAAIFQSESRQRRLALLYVDIDEFKQINDRFSHRAGDIFLTEIARRMKAVLRPSDTVARIGGDEFNILLPEIAESADASELASRILEAMRTPVRIEGQDLVATVSIGIAIFPDDGAEAGDLQRQADAAMYYAKSLGKNRAQKFGDKVDTLDCVRMEQDLRHALQEGWFAVHYQPKFSSAGHMAGVEALIRMNHPRHGQILPGEFISIAESTGLIVPIGAWVIAEVCRQLADWRRRGLASVVVAVNVSAVQMSRSDFARSVEACLTAHDVPSSCLELEVTESMVVNSDSEAHCQMQLLRESGVLISIDDFGTGFSSLSYLHQLRIDAVKLDRSFVQNIGTGTDDAARRLVRAMVGVAQGLGLDVIAEGVETEEQRVELVAAGCPVMQGYLFARPGPPELLDGLLAPGAPANGPTGGDLARLYGAIETISGVAAVR